MSDTAATRLYRAIAGRDTATAISVIEEARAGGVAQADLFDALFLPAMAALGDAWAAGELDEVAFAEAAIAAEQVTSFVTPPSTAPDRGIAVVAGSVTGDTHDIRKNLFAAALKTEGYRVFDRGVDVSPGEFLVMAEETGARIVLAFAETAEAAEAVAGIRERLDAAGRSDVALVVAGGPFEADPDAARAAGANGVANTAQGMLRVVARIAERLGGGAS